MNLSEMEPIIAPVDKELLKAELTESKKLRDTNKGGNELYVFTAKDSPNLMREVGRLREEAFRADGGSTGKSMDVDEFDTEELYGQLIVWDPDAEAIIGGYRYAFGPDIKIKEDGQPNTTGTHIFHFSEEFVKDYLPYTMELGRSFVSLGYQSSKAGAKALFALDNLWDGLAAIILLHPQILFFYGKMTIHPTYDPVGRDLLLHFLDKHFGDKDALVTPIVPAPVSTDPRLMDLVFNQVEFKEDYKNLKSVLMKLGCGIPPLVNAYMNLSPAMLVFGTSANPELNGACETAIMIPFDELYDEKIRRHVDSFSQWKTESFKRRFKFITADTAERLKERWYNRRFRPLQKFKERREARKADKQ